MASAGEVGDRVERLLAEFEQVADPTLAARAEELVRTVVEFYGAALERVVELAPEPVLERLADDPLVSGVLVVHDLHPHSLQQRVQHALDAVRPYLGSHSGDVSLVEITDEGVLRLALGGSCNGCPSSMVTVKLAIEQAIEHAAPEIARIDVEGAVSDPSGPQQTGPGGRPLLPIVTAEKGSWADKASWVELGEARMVAVGTVSSAQVRGAATVVCNAEGTFYAYRDRCPACREALSGGHFDGRVLSCPACGAGYDVVLAGRAVSGDGHLDPLPLLAEDGTIRVAVPA
ncbi:NifU family protein [Kutzneria buriramensis]|uniref:Fe-S cluster biogenesis protein NfuA n=1 Tax=Kutzneria buriramensis TaxID=1045776 RepID=A0A3E0HLC6_9PSEU|nr:NifU family protein [Kutzneria buriramensis]REH47264.1 Fe-S cluster biogenesis protein NfuA [Kutzneria buriramensis]